MPSSARGWVFFTEAQEAMGKEDRKNNLLKKLEELGIIRHNTDGFYWFDRTICQANPNFDTEEEVMLSYLRHRDGDKKERKGNKKRHYESDAEKDVFQTRHHLVHRRWEKQ